MIGGYGAFLARKAQLDDDGGFEPTVIPNHLFPFQADLLTWACRLGRSAVLADCGLGKTAVELAWAENVARRTGKPVLLLTPLAVGFQVVAEAAKFGHSAGRSRDGGPAAGCDVTVTNYEQASKFDPGDYGGVVCDESSAIKSFDGRRRAEVTELMRRVPYRFLGTATAAPNDWVELGTSSEALGNLGHVDMLSRFFVNDARTVSSRGRTQSAETVKWRLKGHAGDPFWRWVASWARAVRRPSDLGYADDGYVLPPLVERTTVVEARTARSDTLFDMPAHGLREEREEARRTVQERADAVAGLLEHAAGPAVAWCHLNDESTAVRRTVPGAVEVTGSEPPESKEEKLAAFTRGEVSVLVTKPKLGAWGLNWQHCHRMTYYPSHSYEQYYQAVRRSWRFGQAHEVTVDLVTTPVSSGALANLRRKAGQADEMFDRLVAHVGDAARLAARAGGITMEVPSWL